MSYKVIPVEKFKKEAKRLIKKYPSLKSELVDLATHYRRNLQREHHWATISLKSELP
jgi:hypothetical protein